MSFITTFGNIWMIRIDDPSQPCNVFLKDNLVFCFRGIVIYELYVFIFKYVIMVWINKITWNLNDRYVMFRKISRIEEKIVMWVNLFEITFGLMWRFNLKIFTKKKQITVKIICINYKQNIKRKCVDEFIMFINRINCKNLIVK